MMKEHSPNYLSSSGLQNILKNCEDDFKFVIGPYSFPCNKFQAQFISPKVSCLLYNDRTLDTYSINVQCDSAELYAENFRFFVDLMQGKPVSFKNYDLSIIEAIANELHNEEIVEVLDNSDLTVDTIIFKIKKFRNEKNISFLASHIQDIPFSSIPIDSIEAALSDKDLKIESYDWLLDQVCESSFDINEKIGLLGYIELKELDEEHMRKYFNLIGYHGNLTSAIWDSIKQCVLHFGMSREVTININQYSYSGRAFDGIISSGIIPQATCASEFDDRYKISNILTNDDTYFCSNEKDNAIVQFDLDFSPRMISIQSYVLKSWKLGANGVAPVSWELCVKNDTGEWVQVDVRTDCNELIGNSKWSLFCLNKVTDGVSEVRFIQRKSGNPGNQRLALSLIEFYGTVTK
jgi:hypothetical protein